MHETILIYISQYNLPLWKINVLIFSALLFDIWFIFFGIANLPEEYLLDLTHAL